MKANLANVSNLSSPGYFALQRDSKVESGAFPLCLPEVRGSQSRFSSFLLPKHQFKVIWTPKRDIRRILPPRGLNRVFRSIFLPPTSDIHADESHQTDVGQC